MKMLRFFLAVTFLTFPRCRAKPRPIARMLSSVKESYPGFHPNAIVDVGANMGLWSLEARAIFKDVKLLLLEGSPQHNATLAEVVTILGKDADYRIGVLSETADETVQYFQGGNTGNSMFKENSKHYVNDKPVKRITSTLDTMVENSHLKNERIDVIKVDVQGAELVVFKGAKRALSQATFVYFEGSTVEYNEGGSCLYEVDAFLRSQGFFLYDYNAKEYNDAFKTRGMGQFDVMYVRPDSDRLPQYLASSGVKFCGYGRNGAVTTDSKFLSMQGESISGKWKETGFVETWASGFLVGVVTCMLVTSFAKKRDSTYTSTGIIRRNRMAVDA